MADSSLHLFPNDRFVDLDLYQYGWERCKPLHSYGPYIRNHYLFHYILSGSGTLQSNDSGGHTNRYHIHVGQGFLISPGQVNTYYADENTPWEYTWIEFDGLRVPEALESAGLSIDSPVYRSCSAELSRLVKEEMLYLNSHSDSSSFHQIGHLYLFLDALTKSSAAKRTQEDRSIRNYYVKEAISFIEQNYQHEVNIEEIAAFCNLNRSYFGTIFKNVMGKTPQEFLISYRMSKAAQLLKTTHLSIAEIGVKVGYSNQLHFSRAFKSVYNLSPRKWRADTLLNTAAENVPSAPPDSK